MLGRPGAGLPLPQLLFSRLILAVASAMDSRDYAALTVVAWHASEAAPR